MLGWNHSNSLSYIQFLLTLNSMKFTIFSVLLLSVAGHVVTALPIASPSTTQSVEHLSEGTMTTEALGERSTLGSARVEGIFLRNVHYYEEEASPSPSASTRLAFHMDAIHF
ncbi:hypothetical protein D9756_008568 [Leucocoprinus leucothites]|uniref:Uncharacterized protein n=1 Tax=Leucocoprinus leucothites TaxID=201217 RepID=A0A8H5D0Y6_9AGAR|nr:hypothetical protein D9756_008568 [Leucoagaricus leucothites]